MLDRSLALVGFKLTEYAFKDLLARHCFAKKPKTWRKWHLERWESIQNGGKSYFGRDLAAAFTAVLWD